MAKATAAGIRRPGRPDGAGMAVRAPAGAAARWSAPRRWSHAEHAEPRRLDRRIERGRDAQSEDAPGVRGIDDAVVPQPRGGIPGAALRLVLLADGCLE